MGGTWLAHQRVGGNTVGPQVGRPVVHSGLGGRRVGHTTPSQGLTPKWMQGFDTGCQGNQSIGESVCHRLGRGQER